MDHACFVMDASDQSACLPPKRPGFGLQFVCARLIALVSKIADFSTMVA
jgi:hypothetical protein